jgi:PPOX class probable F420-dependent enzyme
MSKPVGSLKDMVPASHLAILETAPLAMVSTIRHKDGQISTNPVGFDWDGESFRFSTLKERVKYTNLLHNPLLTVCILDPVDATRYIEIRGVAEITDDPQGTLNKKVYRKSRGQDAEFDLDGPGVHRVIVTLLPHQVSAPLLYGGRLEKK